MLSYSLWFFLGSDISQQECIDHSLYARRTNIVLFVTAISTDLKCELLLKSHYLISNKFLLSLNFSLFMLVITIHNIN